MPDPASVAGTHSAPAWTRGPAALRVAARLNGARLAASGR
jgi:hypothetical protein